MAAESLERSHPRPAQSPVPDLPMKDVVRSACPGCQRTLTVPADWVGKTVRCKHCGHAMQIRQRTPAPAAAPPPLPRTQAVAAGTAAAPAPTWEPLPDNGPLPEYAPPLPQPAAAPVVNTYVSAFDTRQKYSGRGRYRGPRNRGWVKYAVLGLFVAALAGGIGAAVHYKPDLFKVPTDGEGTVENNGGPVSGGPYVPPVENPANSGAFPRRMLAISIHSYLYANPLHNGDSGSAQDESKGSGTDAAVRRLAERWKVPKDQLYHLTDVAVRDGNRPEPPAEPKKIEIKPIPKKGRPKKGADKADLVGDMPAKEPAKVAAPRRRPSGVPPLKNVVEGTIARFLDTSRAQDRIVLLFCGHVVEKAGVVYLVPLEGDLDDVESLIPLRWFYDRLAACPAQEKVVVYDVCRLHPEAGISRPHPGPMTEAVEKALHESPAGVSVVTSCSKGEHAVELGYLRADLEFERRDVKDRGFDLHGSFFLSLFHVASVAGALSPDNKLPSPADELPVERMAAWLGDKLADVVKRKFSDRTQTVKATIKRKGEAAAFNGTEPVPGRFEFPVPPPSADPKAISAILNEIELPPIKPARDDAPPVAIAGVLPFSEEAMKDYLKGELKANDKPNEFQQAVLDAVREMRGLSESGSGFTLREDFGGDTSDRAKEELRKVQDVPARVESILQDQLDALEQVAEMREKQPKRWQVHYDYVLAQVKLRICYANQYNLALANFRSGKLPDLKEDQKGYGLTAEMTLDKNTPANYKDLFAEARKALTALAQEHPRTPWALLAKSDRSLALGLRLTGSSGSGTK
jgi:hypothetical protein